MDLSIVIGLFLIAAFFLVGSPLAVTFGLGSIVILLFSMGFPLPNLAQLFFSAIASYPLLACPFFILAGHLILRSGGMIHLQNFLNALVGHFPGGLAVSTIIFATFLGSISGSSAACLAIIGTVMVPILVESGYDRPFASGLAVTSAELGLLIPPSIFFILFGAFNQVSIADLFLSGIGPGLLSAILMSAIAVYLSKRRNYSTRHKADWAERLQTFVRVLPLIVMPIVVLGGIYSGMFSPTQAAVVSVYYAMILGFVVYRKLTWRRFLDSTVESVKLSSIVYLLIIGADLFGRVLGYMGLPQAIAEWTISFNLGPLTFLIVVEVLLLGMGFFFSSIPMVIIILPIFMPTVKALGIDPVLYGCLAIFCSMIGEITPPFGPQLWLAEPICEEKMGKIAREAWIFLVAQVLALFSVTFIPPIAMYLVNLMR